jgi:hypothetical protein
VVLFLGVLIWRATSRPEAAKPWRDPTAVLVALGWALGFAAVRFWSDWSAPALAPLIAVEVQGFLERQAGESERAPLLCTLAAAALLILSTGADYQGRWSDRSGRLFLARDNPTHAPWLPEPGGVAYTADMGVFYALFFKNPDAPWRYVLGFEPAIMRPEDYAVYMDVRSSRGATEAYLPWLSRMRPQDRLYVVQRSNVPPPIPGLDWFQPVFSIWAARPAARPGASAPAPGLPPAVTGRP